MTASGVGGGQEMEGWSKKEKGLMDTDNSVVIARWRGIKRLNGNGKNMIKIKLKNKRGCGKNFIKHMIQEELKSMMCVFTAAHC